MSGVRFAAVTAEQATGTSLKTLLQIVAAANHRVLLKEISISFKGVSNTAEPILVQVFRQSSAGTSVANTPTKVDEDASEVLQVTARDTFTVEPTTTTSVMNEFVHPQGGYTWQAPFGGDIIINGGDRIGIAVNAAADVGSIVRVFGEE